MNKYILICIGISINMISGCVYTQQISEKDAVERINIDISQNPSSAGGGIIFYVCDDGNDKNEGLSITKPWKSFEKGIKQFNKMNAGDAVLFCNGGVFRTSKSIRISNPRCKAKKACVIANYKKLGAQNNTTLPKIESTHSQPVFNFQDGGNADHDEGYLIKNLNISGTGSGVALYFFNDVDDVHLDNITINSFGTAIQVAAANTPNKGANRVNERISVQNVKAENVKQLFIGPGVINGTIERIGSKEVAKINKLITPIKKGKIVSSFFVCDDGSDDNDGISPNAPWRTFDRAIYEFNFLEKGSGIYFCNGGEFYVESSPRLVNYNCSSEEFCVISNYQPENSISNERPLIFSPEGLTVFNFQDGGRADQDGGYLIQNLILKSAETRKPAIFLYNDVDDLIIKNLEINGFSIGIQSSGSNKLSEGSNGINERIIVKNSTIVNNSVFGWLGGCSDCKIDSNIFKNNGFERAIFNHNIYFSGKSNVSKNVVISNNVLKDSTIVNGKCSGVSLVVHGRVKNLTIENNLVQEKIGAANPTCWGISIDPGWSSEEKFEDIIIRGNRIINVGNVAIGCASCVNVLIESNYILHENDFGFSGIKVPVRKEDTVKSSDVVIRNNLINILNSSQNIQNGITIKDHMLNTTIEGNKVFMKDEFINCLSISGVIDEDFSACESIY